MSVFAIASLIALRRCAFTSLTKAWIWLSCAFALPRALAAAAASSFAQSEFAMPSFVTYVWTSWHRLAVSAITVIVCVADAWLPLVSVAVYLRLMTSGLAGDPAPPLFDSLTAIVTGPQLSDAVASAGLGGGT